MPWWYVLAVPAIPIAVIASVIGWLVASTLQHRATRHQSGPAPASSCVPPGDDVIEQRVEDPPAAAPRRLVVRGVLRASLTATVLVALYFILPLTGSLNGSAALLLVVGLLAFGGVVTWQVRAVLRSRYPGLRAIEALASAVPLFLLLFAAAYLRMADVDAGRSASR